MTSMPQTARSSGGAAMIASIRCESGAGGCALAQAAKRQAASSNLRKRHPFTRRRGLEVVVHGREYAIEARIREPQTQPPGHGVGLEAGAVVAGKPVDGRRGSRRLRVGSRA